MLLLMPYRPQMNQVCSSVLSFSSKEKYLLIGQFGQIEQ